MKKIIFGLLLLLPFLTRGQSAGNDTTKYVYYQFTYGNTLDRYWAKKVLLLPNDTVYSKDGLAVKGGTLYVGNGIKWSLVTGGGAGLTLADTGYTKTLTSIFLLQKTIDSMKIVNDARYKLKSDSAANSSGGYTTQASRQKLSDSLLGVLLHKYDTAAGPNYTYVTWASRKKLADSLAALIVSAGADSGFNVIQGSLAAQGLPIKKNTAGSLRNILWDTAANNAAGIVTQSSRQKLSDSLQALIAGKQPSGTYYTPSDTGYTKSLVTPALLKKRTDSLSIVYALTYKPLNDSAATASSGFVTQASRQKLADSLLAVLLHKYDTAAGPNYTYVTWASRKKLADSLGALISAGGGVTLGNPSGTDLIDLTNHVGVASTAARSDSRHAIDVSISPTWTGSHTWTGALTVGSGGTISSYGNNFSGTNSGTGDFFRYFANGIEYARLEKSQTKDNAKLHIFPNGVTDAGKEQYSITSRKFSSSLGFPVAYLHSDSATPFAIDISPGPGNARGYLVQNGNAWFDAVDRYMSSDTVAVRHARIGIDSANAYVDALEQGGLPAPNWQQRYNTVPYFNFNLGGAQWFAHNWVWNADTAGYARYQLLNGNAGTSAGMALAVGSSNNVELFSLNGSSYTSPPFTQNTTGLYAKGGSRLALLTNNAHEIIFGISNAEVARLDGATGAFLWGTTTNVASSMFTPVSTTKGMLFPVMTLSQFNAISSKASGLHAILSDSSYRLAEYNGTKIVTYATTDMLGGASGYNQMQLNSSSSGLTQRAKLNFSTDFTAADNSGNASTDIGVKTLYNTDGSLTGNRTVSMGSNTLSFNATTPAAAQLKIGSGMQINGGYQYGSSYISGTTGVTYNVAFLDSYVVIAASHTSGSTVDVTVPGASWDGKVLLVSNLSTIPSAFSGTTVQNKGVTLTVIAGNTNYQLIYVANASLWNVVSVY